MAFTIVEQMLQPGSSMFYDPTFRHILEMHMNQLRTLYAVRKEVTPDEYYQFEGDFYGFLLYKGKRADEFWLLTRLNGMTNPIQFGKSLRDPYSDGVKPFYLEPHPEAIAELQQYFMTLKK